MAEATGGRACSGASVLLEQRAPEGLAQRRGGLGGCRDRSVAAEVTSPLDIFRYRYMIARMARAATTADAFNAVAELRRRQILDVLAGGERPVNDLVRVLGLAQPQVSKHLRVLREVRSTCATREDSACTG